MHQPMKPYTSISILNVLVITNQLCRPNQFFDVPQIKTAAAISKGLQIALRKGKVQRNEISHCLPNPKDIEKEEKHVGYFWFQCSSLW